MAEDYFQSRDRLITPHGSYHIYRLDRLEQSGLTKLNQLPFSIRIMLEALLRQCNEREINQQDVINLAGWQPHAESRPTMPFRPAIILVV